MLTRHRILLALLALLATGGAAAFMWVSYGSSLTELVHRPGTRAAAGRRPHPRGERTGRPPRARGKGAGRATAGRDSGRALGGSPGAPSLRTILIYALLGLTTAVLATGIVVVRTVNRRFANRLARRYRRYEIQLSMHDDAKPRDLDDMIEAIAAALRPPASDRARNGQPLIAIELDYAPGTEELEWTLGLTCEVRIAGTLEGILTQAYPDVWLGGRFEEPRQALDGRRPLPGCVLRLRKRRAYVYPLSRPAGRSGDRAQKPTSPLEGIARAQVAAGAPSTVRFLLWPVIDRLEPSARRSLRQREKQLERAARGMFEQHTSLALSDRRELDSAVEVQGHALFHLELQVAAADFEAASAVAASVIARRGENHLRRLYMPLRERVYRRRFASAYPPWLPALSRRDIVSGGEIAYLFELPTARMKSVPVRRRTRPRIPAPAEAKRYERPTTIPEQPPPSSPVRGARGEPPRPTRRDRTGAWRAALAPFDR